MINTTTREIALYILIAVLIGLLAYLSFAVGEIHQTLKPNEDPKLKEWQVEATSRINTLTANVNVLAEAINRLTAEIKK